jgi:hypothetical protein
MGTAPSFNIPGLGTFGRNLPGGGLNLSSPFSANGVYGETWTPNLVVALRNLGAKVVEVLGKGQVFQPVNPASMPPPAWTRIDAAIKDLQTGDVLAYASKDNALSYEHIALIVGQKGKIACHTSPRFNKDYDDVSVQRFPWVTLLRMP